LSSAVATVPQVAAEERVETFEEKFEKEARALLQSGAVCFKRSTRVAIETVPPPQRFLGTFCRRVLGYPAAPAMQFTVYTTLWKAIAKCETKDDQILVMPLDREYYSPHRLDIPIECRPRDPEDAFRTGVILRLFADAPRDDEDATLTGALRDVDDCRAIVGRLRT